MKEASACRQASPRFFLVPREGYEHHTFFRFPETVNAFFHFLPVLIIWSKAFGQLICRHIFNVNYGLAPLFPKPGNKTFPRYFLQIVLCHRYRCTVQNAILVKGIHGANYIIIYTFSPSAVRRFPVSLNAYYRKQVRVLLKQRQQLLSYQRSVGYYREKDISVISRRFKHILSHHRLSSGKENKGNSQSLSFFEHSVPVVSVH